MAQSSRTFRIFVSSTFADLKEERNALQKYVFPRLRDLCAREGCRFQAVDLRWGVSDEAAVDQQTMKICLTEIERCQRVTPRPNFIVLLGDRYGWRPLPAEIPEDEFDRIEAALSSDQYARGRKREAVRKLIREWYQRDDNAVPVVYCLKVREGEYREYAKWERTERRLGRILRAVVKRIDLAQADLIKYVTSATEQEIVRGALGVTDARQHVFCFFRRITNVDKLLAGPDTIELSGEDAVTPGDFVDVARDGGLDRESAVRLRVLKRRKLRAALKENIREYKAEWTGQGLTRDYIGTLPESLDECLALRPADGEESTLCLDVWLRLSRIIREQISQIEARSELDREVDEHRGFARDRTKFFVGREQIRRDVRAYLDSLGRQPLAIHGESGSGKSALMARTYLDAVEGSPKAVVIGRFIGVTPESSDGATLLRHLCLEIAREYSTDQPQLPSDFPGLIESFQEHLRLARADRRLIIFLDALDQMSSAEARNLLWLPAELPEHVSIVTSTLAGECLSALSRKLPPENIALLEPLRREEGEDLLDQWLAAAGRTLNPDQRREVLTKFQVEGLPLFLRLAFEEARKWRSDSGAAALPLRIEDMIARLFQQLSDNSNHGSVLVSRSLAFLCAARNGLTEDELLDVLSRSYSVFKSFMKRAHHRPPERRLPVVVWSRLYFDLEPYLTERRADDTKVLSFYHRQFREVVERTVLAGNSLSEVEMRGEITRPLPQAVLTDERTSGPLPQAVLTNEQASGLLPRAAMPGAAREAHRSLARYFEPQPLYRERAGARRENLRKLSELPHNQARGGDWQGLAGTLCDIKFLHAKVTGGMAYGALDDFDAALASSLSCQGLLAPPLGFPDLLAEFAMTFRQELHVLMERPETTAQQLSNNLVAHAEQGGVAREAVLRFITSASYPDGRAWLRRVNSAPDTSTSRALQRTVAAHRGAVNAVRISPCSRWIASAGSDGFVRVLQRKDGAVVAQMRADGESVTALAWLPDGSEEGELVSAGRDQHIRVWDWRSERERRSWRAHDGHIHALVVVPDGHAGERGERVLASCADDGLILGWNAATGEIRWSLSGHGERLFSIDAAAGPILLSGGEDRTVRVWEHDPPRETRCIRGAANVVRAVALEPGGRWAVSGGDDLQLRFWSLASGSDRAMSGHLRRINSVAIARAEEADDGEKLVVSAGDDETVRVWDSGSGEQVLTLYGHAGRVNAVAVSSEGWVGSGGDDGTVRLWSVPARRIRLGARVEHEGRVNALARSPDGQALASAGDDSTLRIWRGLTGEYQIGLHGHLGPVTCVEWSARHIVSGSEDWTVRVWSPNGAQQNTLGSAFDFTVGARSAIPMSRSREKPGHKAAVTSLALVSGDRVVSGGKDGGVKLWHLESGILLREFTGARGVIETVLVNENLDLVIAVGSGREPAVWEMGNARPPKLLKGHTGKISSAVLEGGLLVTGSLDKTVGVWDLETYADRRLEGHEDRVTCVAASPESGIIASGSRDGRVLVHDLGNGSKPRTLTRHHGAVRGLRIVAASGEVLSFGDDQWLVATDASNGEERAAVYIDAPITSLLVMSERDLAIGTRRGGLGLLAMEGGAWSTA